MMLSSVYNQCRYKAVVAAAADHYMRTAVKEVQALPQYAAEGVVYSALNFFLNNVHMSVRKVLHNAYWL